MFTVDDLKPGYRVVLHNGSIGMYILEGAKLHPFIYGRCDEKLTDNIRFYNGGDDTDGNETFTSYGYMIEKVYREASNARYWDLDDKDLLWEYSENEETKEITIKEIEDKLGYKIKIVG